MEAFIVIPEQDPHIPKIFCEAGKEARGEDDLAGLWPGCLRILQRNLKSSLHLSFQSQGKRENFFLLESQTILRMHILCMPQKIWKKPNVLQRETPL